MEFYMTNGEFLAIGQLVCSCCKVKSLKGLDFTNSYIIPEAGHPLQPELTGSPPVQELPVAIKKEAEEAVEVRSDEVPAKRKLVARDLSAHRDVVLPGVPSAPGKTRSLSSVSVLPSLYRQVGHYTAFSASSPGQDCGHQFSKSLLSITTDTKK